MNLGDTWGNDPTLQAIDAAAPGVVAQAQQAFPGEDILTAIAKMAPQLLLANNQRQLLNIQLQRAQNGQTPLDASQFGLGVNVGLSPDTSKMLMIGGAALLAVFLLPRLMGRR